MLSNEVALEIVKQCGIAVAALITGVVGMYQYKKSNSTVTGDVVFKETPLIQHSFHVNIAEYKRKVSNMEIEGISAGRKDITIYFLSTKFTCWEDAAFIFAKKVDACSENCSAECIGCNRMYQYAMEMFEDGMKYELVCMNGLIDNNDRDSMLLFKQKLSRWHDDRIERFKAKINDVCMNSDTYRTCNQKGSRILEALDDALFDTINDATFTIMKINGEMNGKKWHGCLL